MKITDAYTTMFQKYPDAVSIKQATKMLQLNRHTISALIHSQQLFALKVGHNYRIPKSSLIEFLMTGQSEFPVLTEPSGNPVGNVVCCSGSNGQTAC